MLSKLLKYDLKAIFRIWWIVALGSTLLSAVAGFTLNTRAIQSEDVNVIVVLCIFFCIPALLLFGTIIGYIRYNKNFFSDEAYLTFTLPVKRWKLLASKLIATVIINIATSIVSVINVLVIFFSLGLGKELFETFDIFIGEVWRYFVAEPENIAVLILGLIFSLVSMIFTNIYVFFSISLYSIFVKKFRAVFSIVMYIIYVNVVSLITEMFTGMTVDSVADTIVVLSVLIVAFALLGAGIFYLTHILHKKKLNLS